MNNKRKYIALLIASVLLLNGCEKISSFFGKKEEGQLVKTIEKKIDDGKKIDMLLPDFTKLVEQEGPTVVNIQATRVETASDRANSSMDLNQLPDNDPFYEFFKRLVPNLPEMPQQDDEELKFGSGFIVSQDGYILTNTHVVAGMNNIRVMLNDKREFAAKLVGLDQQSDVALLKIDATDLPVIKIGNASELKPGEWVAAIGAPFGFDNSVTAGIVSAKGRSLPNENYTPFIQTDVAINPGNSGGPLFNLKGQVVGINSQIYSRSGGFMGISFAIPIDVAMNVAEQLKTTGKVQRGQLGVIIQEVSYDLAKSFGLDKAQGALIAKVLPASPALKAGIHAGDIVRSVDGQEVRVSSDLPVIVGGMPPGKKVKLGVWRNGKAIEIEAELGASNSSLQSSGSIGDSLSFASPDTQIFIIKDIGLSLQTQTSRDGGHLVVAMAEGLSAQAGLRRGDEILAVAQMKVTDENSFRQALSQAGKNIPFLIQRGETTLFLAIKLP